LRLSSNAAKGKGQGMPRVTDQLLGPKKKRIARQVFIGIPEGKVGSPESKNAQIKNDNERSAIIEKVDGSGKNISRRLEGRYNEKPF